MDDPISRVIDFQLRSYDLSKFIEAMHELKRPETLENRLIEAIDLKYHHNSLDDERKRQLLGWMDLGISQRDLAPIMRISQQTVSRWLKKLRESL